MNKKFNNRLLQNSFANNNCYFQDQIISVKYIPVETSQLDEEEIKTYYCNTCVDGIQKWEICTSNSLQLHPSKEILKEQLPKKYDLEAVSAMEKNLALLFIPKSKEQIPKEYELEATIEMDLALRSIETSNEKVLNEYELEVVSAMDKDLALRSIETSNEQVLNEYELEAVCELDKILASLSTDTSNEQVLNEYELEAVSELDKILASLSTDKSNEQVLNEYELEAISELDKILASLSTDTSNEHGLNEYELEAVSELDKILASLSTDTSNEQVLNEYELEAVSELDKILASLSTDTSNEQVLKEYEFEAVSAMDKDLALRSIETSNEQVLNEHELEAVSALDEALALLSMDTSKEQVPKQNKHNEVISEVRNGSELRSIEISNGQVLKNQKIKALADVNLNDTDKNKLSIIAEKKSTDATECAENDMIIIGPNGTEISRKYFDAIDWNKRKEINLNDFVLNIFGHKTLATSSLLKHDKDQLDPLKVADVTFFLKNKLNYTEKYIHSIISMNCFHKNLNNKENLNKDSKINRSRKTSINKKNLTLKDIDFDETGTNVVIGPHGTKISLDFIKAFNWNIHKTYIISRLALEIFGHETLRVSSLRHPRFRQTKIPQLDPFKVADITFFLKKNLNMTDIEIRNSIYNKCVHENNNKRFQRKK